MVHNRFRLNTKNNGVKCETWNKSSTCMKNNKNRGRNRKWKKKKSMRKWAKENALFFVISISNTFSKCNRIKNGNVLFKPNRMVSTVNKEKRPQNKLQIYIDIIFLRFDFVHNFSASMNQTFSVNHHHVKWHNITVDENQWKIVRTDLVRWLFATFENCDVATCSPLLHWIHFYSIRVCFRCCNLSIAMMPCCLCACLFSVLFIHCCSLLLFSFWMNNKLCISTWWTKHDLLSAFSFTFFTRNILSI